MFSNDKEINIPMEERLMVYPKQRQELFINLVENYKVFCPNIRMVYAGLNFNSELKIDYIVIFETVIQGKNLILWDCPFAYTTRAIPAYRYVIKNNLYKEFFDTCMQHFCQIERERFVEFLNSELGGNLSTNENDPKYWKRAENSEILMKGMVELSLLYTPKGFRNSGRRKVD